jgi:hypothetical protein
MSTTQESRRAISSRIIRPGMVETPDMDWKDATVSERIAAVWELTRQCLAWNRDPTDEPRLQRSVSRVQRTWR